MQYTGKRKGEKIIRHPKKNLNLDAHSDKAIDFEEFIADIGIDIQQYEEIFINLILKHNTHIKDRINNKRQYDYLHYIVYQLATYGFKFVDIAYFFMDTISAARIGKWAKNYKNPPFKLKPIQVEIPRDQECVPEIQSWENRLNNNSIAQLTDVMLKHKIYLWHIHKEKFLSIENAKNLKRESRKK